MDDLRTLDLEKNLISELPEGLIKMDSIKTINLNYNLLTKIPDSLLKLTDHANMYLYYNPLEMTPEELMEAKYGRSINDGKNMWYSNLFFRNRIYGAAHEYIIKAKTDGEMEEDYWFRRSCYALFANDPDDAITSAKNSLQLVANNYKSKVCLIVAYTMKDEWDQNALQIMESLPKRFDRSIPTIVYFQDLFKELENSGIKNDFAEIKQYLLNNQ